MRVSLSATALILIISSSTIWAFSPATRSFSVRPSSRSFGVVSRHVPRTDTFLRATSISKKAQGIAEAKVCLAEIESSVQTARAYLKYLEDVAQVVLAYVEGTEAPEIDTTGRPPLPELGDANMAEDYLANIMTAYSAAEDYLAYLEGVAANVREYLSKYESTTPAETEQETKTRGILADLEETALAAREYLVYLKGVASAVEQFLADPSQPPPPELANALPQAAGAVVPDLPPVNGAVQIPADFQSPEYVVAEPPREESKPEATAAAPAPASTGSYLDSMSSSAPAPAASAPAPASTGSYLDNISSSAPARPSGGGIQSYADSMASGGAPAQAAETPTPAAEAPAPVTSNIDKLASTENAPPEEKAEEKPKEPETLDMPSGTAVASDRNYLDSLKSPKSEIQSSGSGPGGYLDAIKTSDSSTPKGSGAAQKTYADNLKPVSSTSGGAAAPSKSLETTDNKPKIIDTFPSDDDDSVASVSVFLSILLIAAGALFQAFNENPDRLDQLFSRARVNVVPPVEQVQKAPTVVPQVAPPSPIQLPPPVVPEPVVPAPPPAAVAPEEAAPVAPAEPEPDFDDWEF